MEKSVVAFFSIETKRIRIRTGEKTKDKITDDECEQIINDLEPILRNKNYYKVWLTFIEKIDYYINKETKTSILGYIILGILGIILLAIHLLVLVYVIAGIYYLFKCIKDSIKECMKECIKKKIHYHMNMI